MIGLVQVSVRMVLEKHSVQVSRLRQGGLPLLVWVDTILEVGSRWNKSAQQGPILVLFLGPRIPFSFCMWIFEPHVL